MYRDCNHTIYIIANLFEENDYKVRVYYPPSRSNEFEALIIDKHGDGSTARIFLYLMNRAEKRVEYKNERIDGNSLDPFPKPLSRVAEARNVEED